jgi:hypothetical protein
MTPPYTLEIWRGLGPSGKGRGGRAGLSPVGQPSTLDEILPDVRPDMSGRVQLVLALALPAILACASTQSGSGTTPPPYANVITREELRDAGVLNAYEAVERLRPRWLVARSGMRSFSTETEVVAFQGTMRLGTASDHRRIGIDGIYRIYYLDGPTAQATLPGINDIHVAGAIVVDMTPPSP